MPRWRATIDFCSPAGAIRSWSGEVEAENAEQASERAVRAFKLTRPRLEVPEIVDFELDRIKGN